MGSPEPQERRGFLAPGHLYKREGYYGQPYRVGSEPAVTVVGASSSAGFFVPVGQPSISGSIAGPIILEPPALSGVSIA